MPRPRAVGERLEHAALAERQPAGGVGQLLEPAAQRRGQQRQGAGVGLEQRGERGGIGRADGVPGARGELRDLGRRAARARPQRLELGGLELAEPAEVRVALDLVDDDQLDVAPPCPPRRSRRARAASCSWSSRSCSSQSDDVAAGRERLGEVSSRAPSRRRSPPARPSRSRPEARAQRGGARARARARAGPRRSMSLHTTTSPRGCGAGAGCCRRSSPLVTCSVSRRAEGGRGVRAGRRHTRPPRHLADPHGRTITPDPGTGFMTLNRPHRRGRRPHGRRRRAAERPAGARERHAGADRAPRRRPGRQRGGVAGRAAACP